MSTIKKSAITEIVYDHITQMLFDGIYPPGSPVTRKELALKMGVSPTPVGEAIARLVGEGIIEQTAHSGYRVKEFSWENLASLFEVRAGLEGVAVCIFVQRAPEETIGRICASFDDFYDVLPARIELAGYTKADQVFHRGIVAFCGNPYITQYNRSYEFQLRSYQKGLLRAPEETIDEHRLIVEAIRGRNARMAEIRMIDHHMATARNIRERFAVVPREDTRNPEGQDGPPAG